MRRLRRLAICAGLALSLALTPAPAENISITGALPSSPIGVLKGANFNSTADQSIPITFAAKYTITNIYVMNCSVSMTTAQGGFYTAASKGGTNLVLSTQAYTSLTTTTGQLATTLTAAATANSFTANPLFLSLTTAQGAAATCDVYVDGVGR